MGKHGLSALLLACCISVGCNLSTSPPRTSSNVSELPAQANIQGGGASPSPLSRPGVNQPMTSPAPSPSETPQPHFNIEAASGLTVPVGQKLQLSANLVRDTLRGDEAIVWEVDEKFASAASISGMGALMAMNAGPVRVFLRVGGNAAKALVAVLDPAVSGEKIALPPDVSDEAPANAEMGTARVINSETEWTAFWKASFKTYYRGEPVAPLPAAPKVDFSQRSVVAWFDVKDNHEQPPVLTHIVAGATPAVSIVFPNTVEFPGNITTTSPPRIFLLSCKKIEPGARVSIEHLRM